ncbi:MAG: hypothetical protein JOZ69_13405 [Myxococcales bacterium]|nr:hypothetical protein [Myxococcales bacterium]
MAFRAFLPRFVFTALSLISVGCSSENGMAHVPPASDAASDGAPDTDMPSASGVIADAGADATHVPTIGSPLCNASFWMCYPDDPSTAHECQLAPDGGAYNAAVGYDNVPLGCHVRAANNDLGVAPVCTPPGNATDGMFCDTGEDCAPGYECVGNGTCRHYCCAGACGDPNDFCDIQTAVGSGLRVPVCAPMHHCNLLDSSGAGSCAPGQTCQVVKNNGATSCVAIGPQQAGDECNTDHCGPTLTCIGNSGGDRTCFQLCSTSLKSHDCPSGQTCTGGLPLFPTPGVGICK